jgi:ATP-dependent RNA helicase HelY
MTVRLGDAARRFLAEAGFEPDPFQIEAIEAIESGASVVVTAPTGSGKTLIAEAAIEIALAAGQRAFYTTPIKALSNQKYRDLVDRYGESGTGLLTGDNSVNGEAPVVVMTTEVLRNMIYAGSEALDGLGVVILDEVHYLQDRYRGSVWEETIIHLPADIQLVNLSATVANGKEFAGWMRARRGATELVVEEERPVPLESVYLLRDRYHTDAVEWFPIFGKDGMRANPRVVSLLRKGRGRLRRFATPRRLEVAEALLAAGLLPAIYFIFSRAGCDQAARTVASAGLRLTSADEREVIRTFAADAVAHLDPVDLGVLGYDSWLAMLESGVAAHHAGMVPAFKEAVEELFADGYIKLVFATETLALGINMPAKAVVLESFSKFNGESHELLRPGDYTQLTGRAGRRGIDDRGTAVVLYSSYVPFKQVADVAAMGSHPLVSSFEPSYNMAVNLVANYPKGKAQELLRASFAQFALQERASKLDERIAEREAEVERYLAAAQCERGDIEVYASAPSGSDDGLEATRVFLEGLDSGDVLDIGDDVRWLILARGYGANPRYLILSEDGQQRKVKMADLGRVPRHLGTMELEEPVLSHDSAYLATATSLLGAWTPDPAFAEIGDPFGDSTVAGCPKIEDHLTWLARSHRSAKDLRRLLRRRSRSSDDIVERFQARMQVLDELGYVKRWVLSEKGERLRRVYSELDLLLAETTSAGLLDGLTAAEFAAVVSLFTFEPRRADPEEVRLVGVVADRASRIEARWRDVAAIEEQRRVPATRAPEPGFAPLAYGWVAGADLEELFGEDDFAAGDFVRNCRQLLDLMRQIRDAFPALADVAGAAISATDRGIVAVGGRA